MAKTFIISFKDFLAEDKAPINKWMYYSHPRSEKFHAPGEQWMAHFLNYMFDDDMYFEITNEFENKLEFFIGSMKGMTAYFQPRRVNIYSHDDKIMTYDYFKQTINKYLNDQNGHLPKELHFYSMPSKELFEKLINVHDLPILSKHGNANEL